MRLPKYKNKSDRKYTPDNYPIQIMHASYQWQTMQQNNKTEDKHNY